MVTAAKSRAGSGGFSIRCGLRYGTAEIPGFHRAGARLFLAGEPAVPTGCSGAPRQPALLSGKQLYDGGRRLSAGDRAGGARDLLAIFKERELHAASYTPSRVSAGEAAAFTVEKLRSAVGCDRPETIALCGNRLVWTHSGGAVLHPAVRGQRGGMPLRPDRAGARGSAYEEASAAVFDGHYLLLLGNTAYLLRLDEGYHRYTIPEGRGSPQLDEMGFRRFGVSFRRILARDGRFVLEGYAARASDGATVRFFFPVLPPGTTRCSEIPEVRYSGTAGPIPPGDQGLCLWGKGHGKNGSGG